MQAFIVEVSQSVVGQKKEMLSQLVLHGDALRLNGSQCLIKATIMITVTIRITSITMTTWSR